MKTVLVVDDQRDIRNLISATLNTGDMEILEACSGDEALKVVRGRHPDLVIMDVMMPGHLDGVEVCRAVKSDPSTRDICVILLTANGLERDKKKGGAAGADDYFVKPFSPRELMDKVYSVLHL